MAEQTYYMKLTEKGLNAYARAGTGGPSVDYSFVAVGDGNGHPVIPDSNWTALTKEVWRDAPILVEVDKDNPRIVIVEMYIPHNIGGFTVREIGLFASDGTTMLAVGNYPDSYKPTVDDGAGTEMRGRFMIEHANAANTVLKIDPAIVMASREYAERVAQVKIDEHDEATESHDHLARKSVKIIAGSGLKGGGDLSTSRTITLGDWEGKSAEDVLKVIELAGIGKKLNTPKQLHDAIQKLIKISQLKAGPDYHALFSVNDVLVWRPTRRFLTAPLTLYISPSGDDANLGTDKTNPKKTLESALEYLRYIDSAGYAVSIVALPGTYGEDGDMRILDLSSLPFGTVIRSESDNPKDTVFRGRLTCTNSGNLTIRGIGFLFDNIAGAILDDPGVLRVVNGGTVGVMNCEITNGDGGGCMSVYCAGSLTNIYGACVVTATKNAHSAFFANIGGTIYYHGASLKITGNYSYAVMGLEDGAILSFNTGSTIAGPATGQRYIVRGNSLINTRGGGINYIPGSIAGTIGTGGQYV